MFYAWIKGDSGEQSPTAPRRTLEATGTNPWGHKATALRGAKGCSTGREGTGQLQQAAGRQGSWRQTVRKSWSHRRDGVLLGCASAKKPG